MRESSLRLVIRLSEACPVPACCCDLIINLSKRKRVRLVKHTMLLQLRVSMALDDRGIDVRNHAFDSVST